METIQGNMVRGLFYVKNQSDYTCFYSLDSEDIFDWRGQEHLRARVDPVSSGSTNKLTLENEPLPTQAGKDAKLNRWAISKFPCHSHIKVKTNLVLGSVVVS